MPPPGHRHNRIAPAKPALERARGETMARVAGVDLPREKRGEIAVTYIYGIGKPTAINILKKANIDGNKRVKAWSDEETARVREIIERELKVEGDLRREISMNVKRLMDIGSYRGIRHRRGLPVRGQRTHTNARTRKGKTRGVMVKKKPVAAAAPAAPAAAAAQTAAELAARKAMEHGLKQIEVFVRGPGAGREAAIRSLLAVGLVITAIR